ncbi:hypothetical protein Tco_0023556 [Tanacetum coccineum]
MSSATDSTRSGGGGSSIDDGGGLLRDDDGKSNGGGENDDGNGISYPGRRTIAELVDRGQSSSEGSESRSESGKVVTSSFESNKMINGMSTPARGVTEGRGGVIVL